MKVTTTSTLTFTLAQAIDALRESGWPIPREAEVAGLKDADKFDGGAEIILQWESSRELARHHKEALSR
jgi:hypothetical protein